MFNIKKSLVLTFLLYSLAASAQTDTGAYHDQYRPQVHFSPKQHWINDPNGMVYFDHTYHLFYQYYPNGTTWGPMHWGHAISSDLDHWKELPIALYPDSLGYIFSGSAVVDSGNTSGFGANGKIPLVAIFTSHDPKGEKEGKSNFQNESLAYSLDNGYTWTKYSGNPVLKNSGIRDFRDPKVRWYPEGKKWIMTLATKDHITFYVSPDLKNWVQESEFGLKLGAHGGVWECPDLFPLTLDGKTWWVLIVNVNPGGPNGGSGTQYFLGGFDGNQFTPVDSETRWLDYGPDEYAGVTWNNTGNRRIFLGWMSNWEYANQVPTVAWRNAMTYPRELKLAKVDGKLLVRSEPVKELSNITAKGKSIDIKAGETIKMLPKQYVLKLHASAAGNLWLKIVNGHSEQVIAGFDKRTNEFYIDRTQSGKTGFQKDFKGRFVAPRLTTSPICELTLVVDATSMEFFADNGLTVMTCIYFPGEDFNTLKVSGGGNLKGKLTPLSSIWK